ncbi:LolA-like protein [Amycolatopsis echigonensis]|uniref:LppX_LprAFG lipoprotein n=1 Tax=Amycolatopsis echigonensis TaxID=2576905 RepID=A0A2N3WKP4_9PSEU|nr:MULTISPECIES: hypothetical protein [Amycolatopsis]MBB2502090.1 hypothetical protein [Amycolatopsis echigonensis]PKV94412.1 hypothetical protein ATK30_5289 [Amycolatopsis niigatensis]
MRKTTTFAVAAGAALALVLTGCGSSAENGTAVPAGQQAKDGGSGLASPFSDALKLADAAKQGTEKAKSAKMSMDMSMGGQSMQAEGSMRFDGENSAMTMTMNTPQGTTEMRYVDKTLYMKVPAAQATQFGTDKPWLKISPDATDPMSQSFSKAMAQSTQQSDPTQILDQVSKTGQITGADQVELNGEKVNHYKVELDVSKSIETYAKGQPAEVQEQMKKMLAGKNIKIPAEIWIDKDQLPLQVTMDQSEMMKSLGASTGSGATGGKITVKYTDWGKPVDVAAPPADQVTDFGEVMKKMGH